MNWSEHFLSIMSNRSLQALQFKFTTYCIVALLSLYCICYDLNVTGTTIQEKMRRSGIFTATEGWTSQTHGMLPLGTVLILCIPARPRYHPIAAMLAPCKCMLYTYLSPGRITGLTIQEKMWCTWRRGGIPAFPGSGKSMREFNSHMRGQILLWTWFILVLHLITDVHQTTPLVCPLFLYC